MNKGTHIKNGINYSGGGGSTLPPIVNNRYLHTNNTTGDLEWAEIENGNVNAWVGTQAEYEEEMYNIPDGYFIGITDDEESGGDITAEMVSYDNTITGIEADNIQDAIDEVFQYGNSRKSELVDKIIAKGGESSTSDTWDEVINDIDTIPTAWDSNNDWEIARFQYTTYSSSQVRGYTKLSNKDGTITKDNQVISVTEGNDISISYNNSVWGFYSKKGGTYLYGYVSGSPSTYQWFDWQIINANAGELIHILPFDSFGQMICIKLS